MSEELDPQVVMQAQALHDLVLVYRGRRDKLLIRLYKEGVSCFRISKVLAGRMTPQGIEHVMREAGVYSPRPVGRPRKPRPPLVKE